MDITLETSTKLDILNVTLRFALTDVTQILVFINDLAALTNQSTTDSEPYQEFLKRISVLKESVVCTNSFLSSLTQEQRDVIPAEHPLFLTIHYVHEFLLAKGNLQ